MMFSFKLKNAAIYQAVKWEKFLFFRFSNFFKKVFLVSAALSALAFLYFFIFLGSTAGNSRISLGIFVISLNASVLFWLVGYFMDAKLKEPKNKISLKDAAKDSGRYNLAELLDFDCTRAVFDSLDFAESKGIASIDSSFLLYFLLRNNKKLNFIFSRAIIDLNSVEKILEMHFTLIKSQSGPSDKFSKDFQDTIIDSLKIASEKNHSRIQIGDILLALSKYDLILKKILIESGLRVEDIENLVWWIESLEEKIRQRKRFWDYKNLSQRGSLAKTWASGYTITLDMFSSDWTDSIKREGFKKIIGHKEEISQVERILAKTETKNVLLIGEPGSGRGSIIEALAQKCLFGESLPGLNYKRIVELNIPALLAQTGDSEEVEALLNQIFSEVMSAGNIILVINDFHDFVGQLVRPGIVDISGVLAPYLKSPRFQILAVTTFEGLHRKIEQNSSVLSLLEKVEVSEITERETLELLENAVPELEWKFKKFITYSAIRDIVVYSGKYIPNVSFPKKALDLLDEVVVFVSRNTEDRLVLPKHVAEIISEKTQIPVGEIDNKEKEILLNLEDLIHQRIINQQEAVGEISTALRRARAEITIRKGPIGAFLFLGPTGVGKTETAKALAEIYFGSEEKMIRLDMSEFQSVNEIGRIIGSQTEEGFFTTKVRENPFSLILLDEFEKAHPNILNIFLQVFDEGHLTDGMGRKVDFKNSLIIATSNAGYKIILEALKNQEQMSAIKGKLVDFLFQDGIFRPELINRFDGVVVFKSLTKENLLDIAGLLLKKLKQNLENKGIYLEITPLLKEKIVEFSYNPVFGAREMRRVIQDKIENNIAVSLLSGEIKRGDKVGINPENFKLLKE